MTQEEMLQLILRHLKGVIAAIEKYLEENKAKGKT